MGQKLSDLTSQRVIVLILTMLICIPGFNWNSGLYGAYPSAFMGGLSSLHDAYTAYGNSTSFQQACLSLLDSLFSGLYSIPAEAPCRHCAENRRVLVVPKALCTQAECSMMPHSSLAGRL